MLTITRKDLLLTINDNVIPAMGSSDVPVKFVNDTETYVDFLIEPRVGYYVNGCPKSGICEYDTSSNIIKIPAEAFKNKGILVIAIALIDNADSNHIEVTKELALEVTPAPNGTVILPATDTWQTAVKNLVEQLYNQDYKPQFDEIEENLHNLVEEAQNQQNKANNQQTQIDNAIDVMGDYEIVQDNPTQIRFKKGDGTYGNTVNLGDNLASKSMVNAGYDTYSGNSYSGSASDYGIEIGKASGSYEQVTTNGYQLFDASKLPTTSEGGATATNNGDGSFTIIGSGSLSDNFSIKHVYQKEDALKLLKVGECKLNFIGNDTNPSFVWGLYSSNGLAVENKFFTNKIKYFNVTEDDISKITSGEYTLTMYIYGASGQQITTGTFKPMIYQDGDGTWERFTGGEPAPNPNYPLEPKFFKPKEFVSVSKNLFDFSENNVTEKSSNLVLSWNDNELTYYMNDSGNSLIILNLKLPSGTYFMNKRFSDATVFKKGGNTILNKGGQSGIVTLTSDIDNIALNFANTQSPKTISDLMLSLGETIESYTPYIGSSQTSLNIELRSLPNGVCDTYENRVITRRVGVYIVDTIDTLKTEVTSGRKYAVLEPENKKYQNGMTSFLCNKIQKTVSYTRDDCIYQNASNFVIAGTTDDTLETFKEKFLNTIVYYELAEPTIEQVDLPIIPSYFPYTNAWHDSEVEASDLTWNILARQYGSGQTTIKKDEAVLTELDLNTERTATPTTVKVQLQDSEGKVLYLETSSENIYIQSGRFSGKTVQQVLENSIQAISATDEYIEVDVPDSMTQSIDEEFLVDEVDESETETE